MRELGEKGLAVRDSPDLLEEFAERVRADLLAIVETLPRSSQDDPAARAREQSRRTAKLMAYRFVPPENFEELLRLVAHGGEHIVSPAPRGPARACLPRRWLAPALPARTRFLPRCAPEVGAKPPTLGAKSKRKSG